MSYPFTRSLNSLAVSTSGLLSLPISAASPKDCAILWVEGIDWSGTNAGSPNIPSWIKQIYLAVTADGFKFLGYGKVPPEGLGGSLVLTPGAGQTTSGGWWGHVDVIGGVGWLLPGWVQTDAAGANYATYTRSDLGAAPTRYSIWAQVEMATLGGSTQWIAGWANADMGFGVDSSQRPIIFINNTLGNPIGNAAANAAVPGLAVGTKIWLRGDVIPSTGNCEYFYSADPTPFLNSVSSHWTQVGTAVAGSNGGTTPRVTNSETVFIGTRNTGVTPFGGKVYAFSEHVNSVNNLYINFSDEAPAGLSLLGTANHIRSTEQDLGNIPFDFYEMCDGVCYGSPTNINIPGLQLSGTDRLAYHMFRGGSFEGHTSNPIQGPADWNVSPDRAGQVYGLSLKQVTRTREVDADVSDSPVTADGHYSWTYHQFSFIGRQAIIALPPLPHTDVMQLGCADSYTVWVTDSDYATTIDQFRWSQINWERVLDEVSEARVVIPDELGGVNCVARLGGLQPWAYGLLIERNDQEVWRGPIRNVQRQGRTIVVSAADTLSRMQKRFVIRDLVVPYTATDAGVIFCDILNIHAHQAADTWQIPCPQVTVNVPVTRTLRPRAGKMAWDLLSELLDTALDAYMMNGVLYVWEPNAGWRYRDQIDRTLSGPYNDAFELVYGTFTEDAFSVRPNWAMDGAGQASFVLSATTDTGELGFRQFEVAEDVAMQGVVGVLDLLDPSPLEVPEDHDPAETSRLLKARAASLLRLRAAAPVVMESGTLSRNAPIDVDNLRPGSLWVTDIYDDGYGQLLSAVRLHRISTTVRIVEGGIEESVSPTLYPPGWSGDMGNA